MIDAQHAISPLTLTLFMFHMLCNMCCVLGYPSLVYEACQEIFLLIRRFIATLRCHTLLYSKKVHSRQNSIDAGAGPQILKEMKLMSRVFIIEDDDALRRELINVLELDTYEALSCSDFAQGAQEALGVHADLVILDLNLPEINGLNICRSIRESSNVPILVLTSSDAEFDEVMSMKLGADDYLSKPYRPAVLLAHIARLLQRAEGRGAAHIDYAGISLDIARANVSFDGNEVSLSRNETCILAALIRARGGIVSRQDLMRELWETDQFVDDNTLTVNVNRLRKALERAGASDMLKTHRGQGYSL